MALLLGRTWRYLRYLHLREAMRLAPDFETVISIGAGRGLAELALAIEFPGRHFRVTDIKTARTPNFGQAERMAKTMGVRNIEFDVFDILHPDGSRADFICSTEVLEHIEDDRLAAANMMAMSDKAVFCLVPFADERAKNDPARIRRCWEKFEHYRPGYTAADLRDLFPSTKVVRGCYWSDAGAAFRSKITSLRDEEIELSLVNEAQVDVRAMEPETFPAAAGIWCLGY
jgi:hypothetical protein